MSRSADDVKLMFVSSNSETSPVNVSSLLVSWSHNCPLFLIVTFVKGNDSVQIQLSEFFSYFHNGTLTYNLAKAAMKMGGHRHKKRAKNIII
jgi:hypothetical protein